MCLKVKIGIEKITLSKITDTYTVKWYCYLLLVYDMFYNKNMLKIKFKN